jgi:hypothetical protein
MAYATHIVVAAGTVQGGQTRDQNRTYECAAIARSVSERSHLAIFLSSRRLLVPHKRSQAVVCFSAKALFE